MACHVGLDWGYETHAVCVLGAAGAPVERFTIAHDRAGRADLIGRLGKCGAARDVHIAIERPFGLLVDALIEAGFAVVPTHPNVVKAGRPRYPAVSAKSVSGDAYILADILRTDGHRRHPLKPQSDAIKARRALVRGRDDLVAIKVALANQLTALLDSFGPSAGALFAAIASPIALAFLARYPTPQSAARLGEKRMAAFLAQHHYCGRRSPADLLGRLRSAAIGCADEAEAEAKGELVLASARTLDGLVAEIAELTARIEHDVAQLPEGRIVMSLPRAGKIRAAQITAELGDVRARFATADKSPQRPASRRSPAHPENPAASAGAGPATSVGARPSPASPTSRATLPPGPPMSTNVPARGAKHAHAVRLLARAWIRILWRTWTNGACYEPDKHPAARARKAASQQPG